MLNRENIHELFRLPYNSKEAEVICNYLNENANMLPELFDENEWNEIKITKGFSLEKSEQMWNSIYPKLNLNTAKLLIVYLKRASIAAIVLLAIGLGWLWYNKTLNPAKTNTLAQADTNNDNSAYIIQKNNTNSNISFKLTDGSTIELMPNSFIRYPKSFAKDQREVVLTGEANFSISKDPTRPFTVISENIATTVLGTEFNIKSNPADKNITIELFTGKISVGPNDPTNKLSFPKVELKPGEKLILNKKSNLITVVRPNKKSDNTAKKVKTATQRSATGGIPSNIWYMFGNQSLSEVFEQLEEIFGVIIEFNPQDVENFTYIGRLDSSDNLEDMLNTIALLNDLVLTKSSTGFDIRKK